jgi:dihydroorotate dehydrogenase
MVLFISPPFGNYINLPNTISIRGSFTLEPREGLLKQIILTFRYSFIHEGWINKIGLRNRGLDYALKKYNNKNYIISIAILKNEEIPIILKKIPEELNIELNISCPNIDKKLIDNNISVFINNKRKWMILKLSPLSSIELVDKYYKLGFRQFHISNTLPIGNKGGLSGCKLMKFNENLIKSINSKYKDCEIIGGGGIRCIDDVYKYKSWGAMHFSVSTLILNPIKFIKFYRTFINLNL